MKQVVGTLSYFGCGAVIFGFAVVATFAKEICLGFSDEFQEDDPPTGTSIHGFSTDFGVSLARCFPFDLAVSLGVFLLSKVRSIWGGLTLPGGQMGVFAEFRTFPLWSMICHSNFFVHPLPILRLAGGAYGNWLGFPGP